MAIFICSGSKTKRTSLTSSEELIKKYDLEEIIDQEGMDKCLSRGIDVYCYIDTLHAGLSAGEEGAKDRMCWAKTEEEANDSYYQGMEDV
jgi:hypothetical protein